MRPNAAISVGQTKVKSFGQKKTIFHLPASDSDVIWENAFAMSVETTALRSNAGNLSPTVSKGNLLVRVRCGRIWMACICCIATPRSNGISRLR